MTEPATPPPKQPYSAPTLERFGNLTELTKAMGNISKNRDGGGGNMSKTT